MNVSELVVSYLRALGVRHVFGCPGDPSVEVLEACRREGLDFVLARRPVILAGLEHALAASRPTDRPLVIGATIDPAQYRAQF